MEKLTFEEIIEAVKGEVYIKGNTLEFNAVSTDTRNLEQGNMFIALKGENFNGNEYTVLASEKGASICIVDEIKFKNEELKDYTSIILVKDTKNALLELAMYYRSKLMVRIVGITGSTGKTSTKDLTAAVLGSKYKVFKTKGNFNNEIGLPLMMFQIDNSYDIAILEMGMSNLGEIHRLAKVARPDVGIITNIGISHIENLKTRENILKAKLEITDFFNENNTLIVTGDDEYLSTVDSKVFKVMKVGINNDSDYTAEEIFLGEKNISFKVVEKGSSNKNYISAEVLGKHNVLNSLLAVACGREFNLSYEEIDAGIKNLEATSMRLDITRGEKFTIVDDCYNASPDSMKAALDVLTNLSGKRKIAILGTMKELGEKAYEAHEEIGEYASAKGIDLLISVGEFNKAFQKGFNNMDKHMLCSNNEEAFECIKENIDQNDVVLIKASRSMKFETIVGKLKNINC